MPSPLNKTLRLSDAEKKQVVPVFPPTDSKIRTGIYQCDILTALPVFSDGYFDLIIADPPYNNGLDFGNSSDKQPEEQYRTWVHSWMQELPRITSPTASIYICCDWKHSGFFQSELEEAGFYILNRITWKRDKGRGATKNWKQNMEDIWFAVKDPKRYTFNLEEVKIKKQVIAPYRSNGKPKDWYLNEEGEPERLTHPSNIWIDLTVPFWSMPENTEHPTQKPELLIERIVQASSKPGDKILDLFSGSGTTSVIAMRLGRKPIGLEINPDYVRIGLKRLALEKKKS